MKSEIIIYELEDEKIELKVNLENETVWLTQKQMAELFNRDRTVIGRHINSIFKEEELEEESNVQKMHFPNSDKPIALYSLDVIISVGYRVKSKIGT
ncbi:MAG: cell filamentation protein Fic, partial [Fusobacteriaceae bacterium]